MVSNARCRVLLLTSLVLLALAGCKKNADVSSTAAASRSAVPSTLPARSIAPATETPTATTSASAEPARTAATHASAEPARPAKAAVNSGYRTIQRCCNALAKAAKKPGLTHNKYKAAAAVCAGIAAQAKKGIANPSAARTTLRAQLTGVPVPGGC